ncbi:MAG: T9SS type A sorting domain-containing protein [Ferruginibacter sp.]
MGNTVTITGTNFTGASAVSFGGVPATSFTVASATSIKAVVPLAASGSINVTSAGQTGSRAGFYYLSLSGIITDFEGFWSTTTVNNSATLPNDSHNLLAFTYNGVRYSTGVNNSVLTGQGIAYTPGDFRSLPVANIAGTNSASSIYLAMASKVDGNPAVANASAVSNLSVRDVMTDGGNGLNMGTGVTNLPASAIMTFEVHVINLAKITDAEPDILITQIADPSSGNDVFQFVNANGVTVGNSITQDMTLLTMLGTYTLDLFDLSPGAPFNSAKGFSASSTNTTRNIRLAGFKLSDFGISAANYAQVAALKITPSGTSDYAFIAFNANAIQMSPNISQNVERSNSAICAGGTASLEVISAAAYGGNLSYTWQESTNGGSTWTTVTDGGNYSGATTKRLSIVAATNNYKYRATVTESGTGYSASCSPFTIAVITPSPPTAVSVASTTTTCLNTLISLSSTVTGGSNLFYEWQTNASGSYVTIPDAIIKTYLPPVNASGVISYRLRVSSGSGCSGAITSSPVVITVVGISSTTPASRCGSGVVSMSATATSGTISWYAASTGGSALATGTTYAPTISANTIFYVATDASQCATGNRVPVAATINAVTWAGTNTIEWSTLANWDCGGVPPAQVPGAINNVTIPTKPAGGRFPTITTTAPINNITISSGASITVASSGIFEIYGMINNNSGTFKATEGTISMRGAAQQIIPLNAFSTNTIKNLTIDNSSGVLLGGELNLTGTLTPTAGTLTTFGYLTLKSDSLGTARVAAGNGPYINGNVNVERYVPARRAWRLMTAPLTNSNTIYQSWQNNGVYTPGKGMLVTAPGGGTGIDSSGNSSLKIWNRASQALQTVYNTKVPISASNNGVADNTGYFIFVRGDRNRVNIDPNLIKKNITTLTSTGYLQTGNQNFTGLPTNTGSFSLIGNPYASPVDLNLILSNSGTMNIKRKFYVWDPQFNSVGGYVVVDDVLNPGVFQPTPTGSSQGNYIQSGQAFFVITNAAGGIAAVEVKESNKAGSNNTAIFGRPLANTGSVIADLFLLDHTDGSVIPADGTRADFNSAFAPDIDDNDNLKYTNTNETFGLLRNSTFLATERRPMINGRDTLFFKLTRSAQTSYQLQIMLSDLTDPALTAMLEDSYTNKPQQLNMNGMTKINFLVNSDAASQVTNRFRIVFMQSGLLPVYFASVKAQRRNDEVVVDWKIENELNISRYEVERSADGASFNKINTTFARGNNLLDIEYNIVDAAAIKGDNFYRIKSIGKDSKILYSPIVKVKMTSVEPAISVYPNPVTGKLINVQFDNQPAGEYLVRITNVAGQLLVKERLVHTAGSDTKNIALPETIQTGTYQLTISRKDLTDISIKIFVQ